MKRLGWVRYTHLDSRGYQARGLLLKTQLVEEHDIIDLKVNA